MATYTLLHDVVSHDTITALQQLLEGAQGADVTGFAFVATIKGRKFLAEAVGSCRRDPHLTRGLLRSLDDELGNLVRTEHIDVTV